MTTTPVPPTSKPQPLAATPPTPRPPPQKPGRWELVREWSGVLMGGGALVLAPVRHFDDRELKARQTRLEVEKLLAEAWDLMGGRPGMEALDTFTTNRADLEIARRLIQGQALTLDPDHAKSHMRLGTYWHVLEEWDKAIEAYRKAIEIKPDFASAHNNLGVALKNAGDLDAAIQAFREALRLDPDHWLARRNLDIALRESESSNP